MLPTLIVLAVSTTLNAIYFLRLVITIYSVPHAEDRPAVVIKKRSSWNLRCSILCFIALNLALGLFSQPVVQAIENGLGMFD